MLKVGSQGKQVVYGEGQEVKGQGCGHGRAGGNRKVKVVKGKEV